MTPAGAAAFQVAPSTAVDKAQLESLARDGTPEERVVIEPQALALAFRGARAIGEEDFEELEGRELDGGLAASITASPSAARGKLLRCRGRVEQVVRFAQAGEVPEHTRCRMHLEGGGSAWIAVLAEPEPGLADNDFVRADGLFVEVFRSEAGADGEWIDAPLIAGARAVKSDPRMDPVRALDAQLFAGVADDTLEQGSGAHPSQALWSLVSYAQNLSEGAIDWSEAPLLDSGGMAALVRDPAAFRGRPVRLPDCRFLLSEDWAEARENPLRLARVIDGWLGSEAWVGPTNGVARYVTPFELAPPAGERATANAFFLQLFAYEPKNGGTALAPLFVLHSLAADEASAPAETARLPLAWIASAAGLFALVAGTCFLLLRDRRRSTELGAHLRERRARRQARVRS